MPRLVGRHRELTAIAGLLDQIAGPADEIAGPADEIAGPADEIAGPADEIAGPVDRLADPRDQAAPSRGLIAAGPPGRRLVVAGPPGPRLVLAGSPGPLLAVVGPPGSGKTALAGAAAEMAAARGLPVSHTLGGNPGPRLVILDGFPPGDPESAAIPEGTAVLITATHPTGLAPELRLGGLSEPELADLLNPLPPDAVHAVWLASGGLPGPALDLVSLTLVSPAPIAPAAIVPALVSLAVAVPNAAALDADGVVRLALERPSRLAFLELDAGLIRLLEDAASRTRDQRLRSRVLARLARELLADPSAAARRRALADEALALARASGDPGTIARVLDDRLHALWDPAAAEERLAVASEIVEQARVAGDAATELRGLFWRFTALAELADLDGAEAALVAYGRAGELAGDAEAGVVVPARQAMLATVRGRFDEVDHLIAEVRTRGAQAGLADTGRLVASLTGQLAILRGRAAGELATLRELARRLPGHFFEATAARVLAESGHEDEAALELARLLPSVLAGTGPRWIGAVADLAFVAAETGNRPAAEALYQALLPYQGRLVVWGGANTITGPVDDLLGRLAARLGLDTDHLDRAIALERRLGALPWLASTLAARGRPEDRPEAAWIATRLGLSASPPAAGPPATGLQAAGLQAAGLQAAGTAVAGLPAAGLPAAGRRAADPAAPGPPAVEPAVGSEGDAASAAGDRAWRLSRDGDDWILQAGAETARLRDVRGLHYLRALLAAPGREIAALDLVAGGAGLLAPAEEPVLDQRARTEYRERLAHLERELAAADRAGDVDRSAAAQAERTALLAELRRATGLGGRARARSGEAERARVNATRTIRAALDRIAAVAPVAGAHLSSAVHTGHRLRYQPEPGGPASWRV